MWIVLFIIINELCFLIVLSWVIVVRITCSLVAALLVRFSEEDVASVVQWNPSITGTNMGTNILSLMARCPSFLCFMLTEIKVKQMLVL